MRPGRDKILHGRAKRLRSSLTSAERVLWWAVRHRLAIDRTHFRRQVVIGRAIADFACIEHRLIVEVDGSGHGFEAGRRRDDARTRDLKERGWRVLRFWNHEVLSDIDVVLDTIRATIEGRR